MELALGFLWRIRQREVTSAIRPVTVAWDNTNQRTILAMDIAKDHCQKDLWDKLSKASTNVEKAKEEKPSQLIPQCEIDHLPRALIADDLVLKQHLEWEIEVVRMTVSGNKQAPSKKNMGEGGKGPGSNFLDSCGQTTPGSGYQRVCRTFCCQTCLQSTATPAIIPMLDERLRRNQRRMGPNSSRCRSS